MSFSLIALLASLGALGGFAAGLLGFGGGVVMFPLLLYVPSLLGFAELDAKTVAAVVVTQVFFSDVGRRRSPFSQRANTPLTHAHSRDNFSRRSVLGRDRIAMGIQPRSVASFWHSHAFSHGHNAHAGPAEKPRRNLRRPDRLAGDSTVRFVDYHRDARRPSRGGKLYLPAAVDLYPESSDANRHRQQSVHSSDQHLGWLLG